MASRQKQTPRATSSRKAQPNSRSQTRKALPKRTSNLPAKQKPLKQAAWSRMMVNPGENPPVRTPSINPFTGAVRSFTRTFAYKPPDEDHLDFAFCLTPALTNTLLVSGGESDAYLSENFYLGVDLDSAELSAGYASVSSSYLIAKPGVTKHSQTFEPVRISPDDPAPNSTGVHWLPPSSPSETTMSFITNSIRPVSVFAWTDTAGVIARISIGETMASKPRNWVLISPSFFVIGFSFECLGADTGPNKQPEVSMLIEADAGTWTSVNAYDLFSTPALDLAQDRISAYRIVSMSLLVTCAASDLTNGGVVAACRAKPGWQPGHQADVYNAITQLQDHSYRGPLRDGAYVWWLPADMDELDFRQFGEDVPRPTRLWVAGRAESKDVPLQIVVTVNAEFSSPSQIFEHEVGPALTDPFIREYHGLDALPAAVCNPKHGEVLKKTVRAAGGFAKKLGRFVAANPDILLALLA